MITKPTVFILGAGASMDYGFPSGVSLIDQLCQDICGVIPNEILTEIFTDRMPHEMVRGRTKEFSSALRGSGCFSIDAFLEDRADLRPFGVLALAALIMKTEHLSRLKDGWYRYLLHCMTSRFETFKENRLSVITFNYDRSFEQYMYNSLKHRFNRSEEETAALVKTVPVYHAYGCLGPLPWQHEDDGFPIGTKPNRMLLASTVNRLKLIYEGQKEVLHSPEVKQALAEAEHIFFLGFGYSKENMARIPIDWSIEPHYTKQYYSGTVFGLTSAEIRNLQHDYRLFKAGDPSHKIEEFLRHDIRFLQSLS